MKNNHFECHTNCDKIVFAHYNSSELNQIWSWFKSSQNFTEYFRSLTSFRQMQPKLFHVFLRIKGICTRKSSRSKLEIFRMSCHRRKVLKNLFSLCFFILKFSRLYTSLAQHGKQRLNGKNFHPRQMENV